MKRGILLILFLSLISQRLFAKAANVTVPHMLNLQSIIFDTDGSVTKKDKVDLTVRILDENNNVSYTEDHNGVPVIDGAINISIGATGPSGGIPLDVLDPVNGPKFVDVVVNGTNPFELMPLSAVPYAMWAEKALGVSDDAITSKQIKNGSIKAEDLDPGFSFSNVSGSIADGQIPATIGRSADLQAHINSTAAHNAKAITVNGTFVTFVASNVEQALEKIDAKLADEVVNRQGGQGDVRADLNLEITNRTNGDTSLQNQLTTHIQNPTWAHAASAVSLTPSGALASTNVQAGLVELDSEKVPIVGDTTILGNIGVSGTLSSLGGKFTVITDGVNANAADMVFKDLTDPNNPKETLRIDGNTGTVIASKIQNPQNQPIQIDGAMINNPIVTGGTISNPTISGTVAGGASYTAPTLTSPTVTGTVSGGATYSSPTINTPAITSPTVTGTVGGSAAYTSPAITGPSITGTVSGGATYSSPVITTPTITGGTFSGTWQGYNAGNASGNVPVSNGTVNTNLNADLLDGQSAPGGTIVGTTDAQILTSKTLTSPVINTPTVTGGSWLSALLNSATIQGGNVTTDVTVDNGVKIDTVDISSFYATTQSAMPPVGTIIPFYDFNGALTYDTSYWAPCDGRAANIAGIGAQVLPDLSNRYLVGFGTDGGKDMGSAAWDTTVVGNANHQINLQHAHTVNAHSHSIASHTHTIPGHTHTVADHAHSIPAHSHSVDVSHTHPYNVPVHQHLWMTQGQYTWTDEGQQVWNDGGGYHSPGDDGDNDTVHKNFYTAKDGGVNNLWTGAASQSNFTTTSTALTTNGSGVLTTSSTSLTTDGSGILTTDAQSPNTNVQLSSAQSIQPRSVRVRFLMRVK